MSVVSYPRRSGLNRLKGCRLAHLLALLFGKEQNGRLLQVRPLVTQQYASQLIVRDSYIWRPLQHLLTLTLLGEMNIYLPLALIQTTTYTSSLAISTQDSVPAANGLLQPSCMIRSSVAFLQPLHATVRMWCLSNRRYYCIFLASSCRPRHRISPRLHTAIIID